MNNRPIRENVGFIIIASAPNKAGEEIVIMKPEREGEEGT